MTKQRLFAASCLALVHWALITCLSGCGDSSAPTTASGPGQSNAGTAAGGSSARAAANGAAGAEQTAPPGETAAANASESGGTPISPSENSAAQQGSVSSGESTAGSVAAETTSSNPDTPSSEVGSSEVGSPESPANSTAGSETPDTTPAADGGTAATAAEGTATAETPAAATAQAAGPVGDKVRFLLFAPGGPLVVDAYLNIDGQPFRQARESLIDSLMSLPPKDGKTELRWEDVIDDTRFQIGTIANTGDQGPPSKERMIRQADNNRNGLVDRDEIARMISRFDNVGTVYALENDPGYASEMDLRTLLDRDQDGVLVESEVAGLSEFLQSFDADNNDLLLANELMESGTSMTDPSGMTYSGSLAAPQAALGLGQNPDWNSIQFRMTELYLFDGKLGEGSFPLVPRLVAALDTDQDGELGAKELPALSDVEPHLVLQVNFGMAEGFAPGVQVLSVHADLGTLEDLVYSNRSGKLVVLPGTSLRLSLSDTVSLAQLRQAAAEQFKVFDKDNNLYLDEKEFEDISAAVPVGFNALDGNKDKMLTPDELAEYNLRQQAPQLSRVRVRVSWNDVALFPALDTDYDGRLGLRELKTAEQNLRALDFDQDQAIHGSEIPGALTVIFTRGTGGGMPVATPEMAGPSVEPAQPDAPPWFLSTDVNGDGDISPREFLGSREQFTQVDSNADGFIDRAEAIAISNATLGGQ